MINTDTFLRRSIEDSKNMAKHMRETAANIAAEIKKPKTAERAEKMARKLVYHATDGETDSWETMLMLDAVKLLRKEWGL